MKPATCALIVISSLLIAPLLALPTIAGEAPRDLIAHCVGCDLSGMDLRNRDLHGLRFVGTDLTGTDLTGADLHGAAFVGSDLRRTKFDRANLSSAQFTGASFDHTSFAGATLTGVKLVGVELDQDSADALQAAHGLDSCVGCDLRSLSLRSARSQ